MDSNGPLSNPTPAVQPDRGERVFMPHSGHYLGPVGGTQWVWKQTFGDAVPGSVVDPNRTLEVRNEKSNTLPGIA